jgi:hypothetical protein
MAMAIEACRSLSLGVERSTEGKEADEKNKSGSRPVASKRKPKKKEEEKGH